MRVRLRGEYAKGAIAAFDTEHPNLVDYAVAAGATEFTVSEMASYAVVDLSSK
jgi:hypothetical protein